MTESEAIETLIGIRLVSGYSKNREEALDMAIAALEKQEGEEGLTMAKYIEREAVIEAKRKQYCADCDRRKGMKNGKMRFCYEIGEAPCRACYVDDLLTDVEDFPAADVVEVVRCRDCAKREICRTSNTWAVAPSDDWYCADGERKMDGGVNDG